jgi:hypothetical protein
VSLLDDTNARGAEIRSRLRELFEQDEAYPGDLKSMWLIGSVDLALEHHQAIWRLQEQRLTGAAFAMVRPLIDTVLRALWVNKRATEAQVKRAWRDKDVFPKAAKMRQKLVRAIGTRAPSNGWDRYGAPCVVSRTRADARFPAASLTMK